MGPGSGELGPVGAPAWLVEETERRRVPGAIRKPLPQVVACAALCARLLVAGLPMPPALARPRHGGTRGGAAVSGLPLGAERDVHVQGWGAAPGQAMARRTEPSPAVAAPLPPSAGALLAWPGPAAASGEHPAPCPGAAGGRGPGRRLGTGGR